MSQIVKIDDEVITADQFIKSLKLTNKFKPLLDEIMRGKVTLLAAKKKGIELTDDDIQEAADNFRQITGLHRAKDTQDWMEGMGIDVDDFEAFIIESVYKGKMIQAITTDEAIESYFQLNSPRFDSVDLSHIVVDDEGKAKELVSLIAEEPEEFEELAQEHSLDTESAKVGGKIGTVLRGDLTDEIGAKVFNASEGDILGPFDMGEGSLYEVLKVDTKSTAELDDATRDKIAELIYNEWLQTRMQEHSITI